MPPARRAVLILALVLALVLALQAPPSAATSTAPPPVHEGGRTRPGRAIGEDMRHSGDDGGEEGGPSRRVVREHRPVRGASVSIYYELVTLTRPRRPGEIRAPLTFVLTPGGQTGVDAATNLRARFEATVLAHWFAPPAPSPVAAAGNANEVAMPSGQHFNEVHLLSWDRRNTGASSFGYANSTVSVLEDEAADLLALVTDELGLPNVHLYGFSSGARVSLRLAADRPDVVRGVVACPPTGGRHAAAVVADNYYTRYIPVAMGGRGGGRGGGDDDGGGGEGAGMEAVAATRFYAAHLQRHPEHRAALLQTHPATFVAKMARSAEVLLVGADRGDTLLGVTDAELRGLRGKVAVGHDGDLRDRIHVLDVAREAARILGTECEVLDYEGGGIPGLCLRFAASLSPNAAPPPPPPPPPPNSRHGELRSRL